MSVRPDRQDQAQILDGGGGYILISAVPTPASTTGTPEHALDHEPAPRSGCAGCSGFISGPPTPLTQSTYQSDSLSSDRQAAEAPAYALLEEGATGDAVKLETRTDEERHEASKT